MCRRILDNPTGCLVRSGKRTAEHHRIGTTSQCKKNVFVMFYATIRHDTNLTPYGTPGLPDGLQLRHTGCGF